MSEEDTRENFCKHSEGGMSVCEAGVDWGICRFSDPCTHIPKCLHRRVFSDMDGDLIHCSCERAQAEAREK